MGRGTGAGAMERPVIPESTVLCPGAIVLGKVTIGEDCFIGPNCVIRGDVDTITIGDGTNLQDNVTVHTHLGSPVTIGKNVSVGHGAVVHGATLEDDVLVGMNAVVLDHAIVRQQAVLGALCLVPNRFEVPARSLAVGIPCKIVKEDDARIGQMAHDNSRRYHRYREEHLRGDWGTVIGPLNDNGTFSR